LTVKLPPEPLTLEADPARLAQVISNLLNNAIKYTPPGGEIELSVSREAGEAVISVRDTGIGIPEDMLEQVFEMFIQVSRDQQRAQGGLGIGLALVRQLVQMHGGRVHAESPGPDQGSTFVVKLPLPAKSSASAGSSAVVQPATGKPHRILVVDDNQDAADSLAMLLQQAGHLTRTVYNGEDALTASREFQPRVVCLDIGLPDTSGYEVAKILRREASASDLTLVALTGWGAEEDRAKARAAGFDVHLTKPVDVNLLERLLASVP
jgi:CheY-like chemotaxis protein